MDTDKKKKRIAILTGGGDAPGLNAVIYTLTKTCILKYGYDVIGYRFGYRGLLLNEYKPLTLESTSGILHKGGSILCSSNKHNLFYSSPSIDSSICSSFGVSFRSLSFTSSSPSIKW